MKKRQVLIIEENSMFGDGVRQLLVRQECLDIVCVAQSGMESLIASDDSTPPDVIIVNEVFVKTHAQIIWQILKAHPQVRLVVLSLEDNRLSVLNNQEVYVTTSADLMSTIVD